MQSNPFLAPTAQIHLAAHYGTGWTFDRNGYVCKPGFNTQFTPEEVEALREEFKAAGIYTSVTKYKGNRIDGKLSGRFLAVDCDALEALRDLIHRNETKAREAAKQATKGAEAARNSETLAATDQTALAWLDANFGPDFANAHNKAGFADFISGRVPSFELYRVNVKWMRGFAVLGLVSPDDERPAITPATLELVRAAYGARPR